MQPFVVIGQVAHPYFRFRPNQRCPRRCMLAHHADAAIRGDRAGRPPVLSIPAEPAMRVLVVEVGGIEQRHQDIYVQQRDTHAMSRNWFTIRILGFEAPAFGTKSNTPLRTFRGAFAASDCLASSEMSWPSVTPSWRDNCLAVASRSSSSSNVVRIY